MRDTEQEAFGIAIWEPNFLPTIENAGNEGNHVQIEDGGDNVSNEDGLGFREIEFDVGKAPSVFEIEVGKTIVQSPEVGTKRSTIGIEIEDGSTDDEDSIGDEGEGEEQNEDEGEEQNEDEGEAEMMGMLGRRNTTNDGNVAPSQNLGGIHIEELSSHGLIRPLNPPRGSKRGKEMVDPTSTNKFTKRKGTFGLGLHYDEVIGAVQWNTICSTELGRNHIDKAMSRHRIAYLCAIQFGIPATGR
ncbi:hypothetical protein JCGZ_05128 [Jatropha curcas]|uniref:Uncharacterized protein n=1 Tax=Jatropha curcas TaxID=180498 RepID=A0A067KRQ6_JATCU|nr:hypothetical protein JCGZ_05128 [Jatropha curcas]